jgi:hypothetical protein
MNKEQLIFKLLESNLDLCRNSTEVNDGLLYDLLRYGFKGFDNMSMEELQTELEGLDYED